MARDCARPPAEQRRGHVLQWTQDIVEFQPIPILNVRSLSLLWGRAAVFFDTTVARVSTVIRDATVGECATVEGARVGDIVPGIRRRSCVEVRVVGRRAAAPESKRRHGEKNAQQER
jgi:hypothetical protein